MTEGPEDIQRSDVPFDRLTHLCDQMEKAIEIEENKDVKGIIFLHDADNGGISVFNYEDDTEALADLLIHMKAIFASKGKMFGVMTDQGVMLMDET